MLSINESSIIRENIHDLIKLACEESGCANTIELGDIYNRNRESTTPDLKVIFALKDYIKKKHHLNIFFEFMLGTIEGIEFLASKGLDISVLKEEDGLALVGSDDSQFINVFNLNEEALSNLLVANDFKLLNLINANTLNYIIRIGEHKGKSIAYLLSSTISGQNLLAANNYRLLNLINSSALNHIIEEDNIEIIELDTDSLDTIVGSYTNARGSSVAYCLGATFNGQTLLELNDFRLANLIEKNTLNSTTTFKCKLTNEYSLASFLLNYNEKILAANDNRLLRMINSDIMEKQIKKHSTNYFCTVFEYLTSDNHKIKLLKLADNYLLRFIKAEHITPEIIMNIQDDDLRDLLSLADNYILRLITREHLNFILPSGRTLGESLILKEQTSQTFQNADNLLFKLFNIEMFSRIMPCGVPLAAYLIRPSTYPGIYTADYFLLRQITKDLLNKVTLDGHNQGYSVGFMCAMFDLDLFTIDNKRLLNFIEEETFNQIINGETRNGESMALYFLKNEKGHKFLTRDNNRLLRMINSSVINRIAANFDISASYFLASSSESQKLLAADDNRLLKLININTLNHISRKFPYTGRSIAYCLAKTPYGLELLAANNYYLLNMIKKTALNHIIPNGEDKGKSLAFWLSTTPRGQELLKANDNRLKKLLKTETTASEACSETKENPSELGKRQTAQKSTSSSETLRSTSDITNENRLNKLIKTETITSPACSIEAKETPMLIPNIEANESELGKRQLDLESSSSTETSVSKLGIFSDNADSSDGKSLAKKPTL